MSLNSILMMTVLVTGAPDNSKQLNAVHLKATREVVRAYFEGNSLRVAQLAAPIAARVREEPRAAIDKELARQGVPSIDRLLVDARMKLVELNSTKLLHHPLLHERIATLRELRTRIDTIFDAVQADPLLSGKIGELKSLKEFEDALWKAHVLRNRLISSEKYILYTKKMTNGISPVIRKRLNETERALVKGAAQELKTSVQQLQQRLDESAMVVRLDRLRLGLTILRNPAPTKHRFQAAFTTGFDARVWQQFQLDVRRGDRPKIQHVRLAKTGLADEVAEQVKESRELAGKLEVKSRQFHEALHWWFRGRYGAGPEIMGLAKSPAAMHSAHLMMSLNMPAEPPTPRVASGVLDKDVPRYDRRHHYTWALENRRVNVVLKQPTERTQLSVERGEFDRFH